MQLIETIKLKLKRKEYFAAYKFPAEEKINFIDTSNSTLEYTNINNLSSDSEGFIFAPFDLRNNLFFFNTINHKTEFKGFISDSYNPTTIQKKKYITIVNQAIKEINSGKFVKIVISRSIASSKINALEIAQIFHELIFLYPHAFISLVALPNDEIWVGASPELLLGLKAKKGTTMALAGTKLKDNDEQKWSEKEIQEQKIVEKYIFRTLQETKQEEIMLSETYDRSIGNLSHICTDFSFTYKNNLVTLLKSLHPTPAVCGLPKKASLEFILKNEQRDREFYAGFLGVFNIKDQTRLYVNLRNIKVNSLKSYLYVGGGITFDSRADEEWEETENKSKIILKALFRSSE